MVHKTPWIQMFVGSCRVNKNNNIYLLFNFNRKKGTFLNGADFLVISQASFDDLSKKIPHEYKDKVDLLNFRSNLIIEGATPFQEDTWKTVQIGTHIFSRLKLCSRCPTTCVDRCTATIMPEPLKTLSKYRTFNNKIMFGCLMNWRASAAPRPWVLSRNLRVIVLETDEEDKIWERLESFKKK